MSYPFFDDLLLRAVGGDAQTWTPPLQMSESISIWCFVIGDNQNFEVVIDPAEPVDGLKTQIKKEKLGGLKDIVAAGLTLYRAKVKDSIARQRQECIDELKRLSQNLNECMELDEEQRLSEIFGNNLPGEKYYVLVQLPNGDPIGPVIDLLSLTQPHPQRAATSL